MRQQKPNGVFSQNTFYYYANEYRKNITEETEIEQIDMTEPFYKEIETIIKDGELLDIKITGLVRIGKSTTAMALGKQVFSYLKKHGYTKKGQKFDINNIARDDQEYSQIMRKEETEYTIIVVDEYNALENTGENVTAELALTKVFSDVQAARYVHRIYCSPRDNPQDTSNIILHITAINKDTMTTHCKLYYRYYEGGIMHIQLLGHVNISVANVAHNWLTNIKKHFYKPNKTSRDKKIVQEAAKKDWYIQYIIKKHEKMELITKEGIFRPRELEGSAIVLNVVNKLKKLVSMTSLIDQNVIKNAIESEARKAKQPLSMVGATFSTQRAAGVLSLWKAYFKFNKELDKLEKRQQSPKTALNEEDYQLKYDAIKEARDTFATDVQNAMQELKHYKEVNQKYHKK